MTQFYDEAYRARYPSGAQTRSQAGSQAGHATPSSGAGRLANLIGAVVSVALVGGMGIWSYRLMMRDVAGVPVIRAVAGPYRLTPDDPGGLQASYQGLAVNAVAADGNAAQTAQTIALAPPPVELGAEDRAVAALVAGNSRTIVAPPAVSVSASRTQTASAAAPGSGPVSAVAIATLLPEPLPPEPLTFVPASRPGVSRSLVPLRRPGGGRSSAPLVAQAALAAGPSTGSDAQAEAVLQEIVTRLGPASVVDLDPATLPAGTRLVQLGAYDSDVEARTAWEALAARFPAYLQDRGRIIEPANAGGRVFYRLRAHGFSDEPEARRFCSVFLAENADCIPVLIR